MEGPRAPRDERRRAQHNEGMWWSVSGEFENCDVSVRPCLDQIRCCGSAERPSWDAITSFLIAISLYLFHPDNKCVTKRTYPGCIQRASTIFGHRRVTLRFVSPKVDSVLTFRRETTEVLIL